MDGIDALKRFRPVGTLNQLNGLSGTRTGLDTIESLLENGFPYSRRLRSHGACVNALTFSSGDGRWLASGGDDMRIRLWDLHQDDVTQPTTNLLGPRDNIFTLAFSATNRYLYSGGVGKTVFRYDTSTLGVGRISRGPQAFYTDSDDSVRSVSCHPVNDDLALTSSEDGTVIRYDARDSSTTRTPGDILQLGAEANSALYHPTISHIFLTSDARGRIYLRDERTAFGNTGSRAAGGIVQKYNTRLTKRSIKAVNRPESSSVAFDRDGTMFAATFFHFAPTIYATSDPNPIAMCSGRFDTDGRALEPSQTYSNSCTIKHGSFGGPGLNTDIYYGAGSDDFCGYIWKIPSIAQLTEQRREISPDNWLMNEPPSAIAFTEGPSSPKYTPVDISKPHCRLKGHRSIVNTVIFHPEFLHVVTAGIERDLILHSPTPGSPCTRDLEPTPTEVRMLAGDGTEDRYNYLAALVGLNDDDRDEEATISMFDYLVREEGRRDIFEIPRWRQGASPDGEEPEEDTSSSSDDVDEGDSDMELSD